MAATDSIPEKGLAHLQVSVRHILDRWPALLQRQHYLRSMSQNDALRGALQDTYAAHVYNALHAVLSVDIIRTMGSIILDNDSRTASLARAILALREPGILQELTEEYCAVAPTKYADADAAAALARHRRGEVENFMVTIANQVDEIEIAILRTDLANVIRTVRNKSVAHNEVVHDGTAWRIWWIEGAFLTYRQLDEYADACTRAVDALGRIVLRTAFSFDDLPRISERYADDFIEALVLGLQHQRESREERKRRNLAEALALGARPHSGVEGT